MIELLVGSVILLGIVGTVAPFLPGSALVGAAILGYAIIDGTRASWAAAAIAVTLLVIGVVAKWVIPARRVAGEVDNTALIVGGVLALVGFFVIPVVGLLVGFIVGVFLTETIRTRDLSRAWPATRQAITAAGIAVLIELTSVVLASSVWLVAVVMY